MTRSAFLRTTFLGALGCSKAKTKLASDFPDYPQPDTTGMTFEQRRASNLKAIPPYPETTGCKRCYDMRFGKRVIVPHGKNLGVGALCETCWHECSTDDRLIFYRQVVGIWLLENDMRFFTPDKYHRQVAEIERDWDDIRRNIVAGKIGWGF